MLFYLNFIGRSFGLSIVRASKLFACTWLLLNLGCSGVEFSKEHKQDNQDNRDNSIQTQQETSSQETAPQGPQPNTQENKSGLGPNETQNSQETTPGVPPSTSPPFPFPSERQNGKLNLKISLVSKDKYSDFMKLVWDFFGEKVFVVRKVNNQENIIGEVGPTQPSEFNDLDPVYVDEVSYFLKSSADMRVSEVGTIKIPPLKVSEELYFTVNVVEAGWNRYHLYLKWSLPFRGPFEIQKKEKAKEKTKETNLDQGDNLKNVTVLQRQLPQSGSYMDTEVIRGKAYEYSIIYSGNKKFDQELPLKQTITIPNRLIDFSESRFDVTKSGYNGAVISWDFKTNENIKLIRQIRGEFEVVLANQVLFRDQFTDKDLPFGREVNYFFVQTDETGNEIQRSGIKTIQHRQPPIGDFKSQFKVEVFGLPRPNEYQIFVNWELPFQVHLKGFITKKGFSRSLIFDSEKNGFKYERALGGESYTVTVEDGVGGVVNFETEIPTDYVLNQTVNMGEFLRIEANRLFILPEGNLFTNGYDLVLVVKEIIAQGGSIRNFSPGVFRGPATKARDGGLILIRAEKAGGRLKFNLDGEDGGRGEPGSEWGEEGRGSRGVAGVSGEGRTRVHCVRDSDGGRDCLDAHDCLKLATSGGDGGPGAQGRRGGQGGVGGSTASLDIVISEGKLLELEISKRPGAGGAGGPGGPGGPGGFGGGGGFVPPQCSQSDIHDGNQGPAGAPGEVGLEGPAGKIMPFCIQLSKDEKQICETK